jgi:sorbitol-specific phosphotransferase system component IIBC
MFTKYNKWFEQTAADPTRRRAAIADFTKRRAILFCCALVITGSALAMFFTATRNPTSAVLESFAAFMSWITVISISSDLRVLQLLDQFLSRDEKATA